MSRDSVEVRNRAILRKRKRAIQVKQSKCEHKNRGIVCEEGYAYIFCRDCFKTWDDEDI